MADYECKHVGSENSDHKTKFMRLVWVFMEITLLGKSLDEIIFQEMILVDESIFEHLSKNILIERYFVETYF